MKRGQAVDVKKEEMKQRRTTTTGAFEEYKKTKLESTPGAAGSS